MLSFEAEAVILEKIYEGFFGSPNGHHIWCNRSPYRGPCPSCDRLYKLYPVDCSPDEMIQKHFPGVIVRKGT